MNKDQGKEKRQEILNAIISFIQSNGYSPTIRELCEITGIKSTATVHHHIQIMIDDGLITSKDYEPRTISVKGYRYVKESEI